MTVFGGAWTETKLDKVEAYLVAFQTVLKNTKFKLVYIDAFSGDGAVELAQSAALPLLEEGRVFLQGSARRALALAKPFDRYHFIDRDASSIEALKAHVRKHHPGLAGRVEYHCGDANEHLPATTERLNFKTERAVVFADPFGMQVDWTTLEAVSRAKVDFWYLAPTSALLRMLSRDGVMPPGWAERLDRFLGQPTWRENWYRETGQFEMFEPAPTGLQRVANLDQIETDFHARLGTVFRMATRKRRLKNNHGTVLFSLMFGCSNPSEAAYAKACKIADHLLKD